MDLKRWRRRDEELNEEIQVHLTLAIQDRIERGQSPEAARHDALREFGNVLRVKESTRETWRWASVETLIQDVRYGIRMLQRDPGFAAVVILILALGIGANTAVYNLIYKVLIQPLPFREPAKLVQIWESTPVLPQLQVTMPDFEDWRRQTRSFDQMAAYTLQAMNKITMIGQGDPEVIQATMATHDLFPVMGIKPMLGRSFSIEEERTKQNVGLISERLWRTKFGANPAIVGKAIQLETQTFVVIGIISDRQAFPAWADFWMPLTFIESELHDRRKYHPLEVIARLKPIVAERQAQTDIQTIALRLAKDHPDTNGSVGAYLIPITREITGEVRPSLLIIWAAAGLVLVIACANLAHLVLSRMLLRRQEMEIRSALGAGSTRLMRQVLTESLLLASAGGGAGGVLALAVTKLLQNIADGKIPRMEWGGFYGPVWLFAISVSLACGVLFGLPAAWNVALLRTSLGPARQGGRSVTRAKSRLSSALLVTEITLAFVVLAGMIVLVRSFALLLNENPGFRARDVLAIQVPLPTSRYHGEQIAQFFTTRLIPAVRAIPGVLDVAATNSSPISLNRTEHSRFATRFGIEGRAFEAGQFPVAQSRWVTPEYFNVLGISLREGRWLTEADRDKPRYLINETLARRFFRDEEPTKKRLIMGVMDLHSSLIEIAGVVSDIREMGLDQEVEPTLYMIGSSPVMTLLVRSSGDLPHVAQTVREIIYQADPSIAVTKPRPLIQYVSDSLARRRFALLMVATFAGLAVFLVAAGIYGSLVYSVSGRLREFGVRAAVGATPSNLLGIVLGEAVTFAILGLAIGVILSIGLSHFMKGEIYQLSPSDPPSMIGAGIILICVVLFSAWLPARRAARTDVGPALRAD